MKKTISAALCAVLSMSVLAGCASAETSITVARVKTSSSLEAVSYDGKINSSESMMIIPSASGKVTSVKVDIGSQVKKGDVLFTIDDTTAQLQLRQAKASLNSAGANYSKIVSAANPQAETQAKQALERAENELRDAQTLYDSTKAQFESSSLIMPAQAAYDNALSNYERISFLAESGEESQYNLDTAKNALDTASAQLENAKSQAQSSMNSADSRLKNARTALDAAKENYSLTTGSVNPENAKVAKAQVESAQAAFDLAQKNVNDTVIKAPIDGHIASNSIKIGDMVSPQVPAMSIINPKNMEMTVNVSDAYIDEIFSGKENISAEILVSATGETVTGIIAAASPGSDPATGLYSVKISIANEDGSLKDGMLASAKLIQQNADSEILIPSESVLEENGAKFVYTVTDGSIVKKEIVTGQEKNRYIAVTGLNADDSVVVEGADKVTENGKFRILSVGN